MYRFWTFLQYIALQVMNSVVPDTAGECQSRKYSWSYVGSVIWSHVISSDILIKLIRGLLWLFPAHLHNYDKTE